MSLNQKTMNSITGARVFCTLSHRNFVLFGTLLCLTRKVTLALVCLVHEVTLALVCLVHEVTLALVSLYMKSF
jgi:hypothetical protein